MLIGGLVRAGEGVQMQANDEEVKANPEMLTKSRLLKLLIKKQYVKLREVTEEEQPAFSNLFTQSAFI